MRQSGDYYLEEPLTSDILHKYLDQAIDSLPIEQIKDDVRPFLIHPESTDVWSREFFREVIRRIQPV